MIAKCIWDSLSYITFICIQQSYRRCVKHRSQYETVLIFKVAHWAVLALNYNSLILSKGTWTPFFSLACHITNWGEWPLRLYNSMWFSHFELNETEVITTLGLGPCNDTVRYQDDVCLCVIMLVLWILRDCRDGVQIHFSLGWWNIGCQFRFS